MSGSSKEAGEGCPSPGASDWVTVTPTNPATTLSDSDFLLNCRARFLVPLIKQGAPCAYITTFARKPCGGALDKGAWHAHACAKAMLNTRHTDLAKL